MTNFKERTHGKVGWIVPSTVNSHSMDTTVETSNTPPRSTVIRMIGGGKGVLDGELVGHVGQEVVGSEKKKVMIGWSDIQ